MRNFRILFCLAALVCVPAHAGILECLGLRRLAPASEPPPIANAAIAELARYETQSNLRAYREPTQPIGVGTAVYPYEAVKTRKVKNTPQAIRDVFVSEGWLFRKVFLPQHPYNQSPDKTAPGKASRRTLWLTFTASRSMIGQTADGHYFSVKMPTDHPHQAAKAQPDKLHTYGAFSVSVTHYMDRIDRWLGEDPQLLVLRDVLAIEPNGSEHDGIVVRDLTPLATSGMHYLPVFSIPFEGGRIAQANHQDFDSFWGRNFAAALGRTKAKLLLRYGLEMIMPNPQNFLVELDANNRPTGRIVVRDFADCSSLSFARHVGDRPVLAYPGKPSRQLSFDSATSFSRLEDEGTNPLSAQARAQWKELHDLAYVAEIEQALGRKIVHLDHWDSQEAEDQLNAFLASKEGRRLLSDFWQRRGHHT